MTPLRTTTSGAVGPAAPDPEAFDAFEAAGWEAAARGYDEFFEPITARFVEPMLTLAGVGPGDRLLDVACGPGSLAGRAADRGADAVGVDVAAAALAVARRRRPDLDFRRADARRLPFPTGSFDVVAAGFALMHVGDPGAVVSELARVTVPGGRLVVAVWDAPERARLFELVLGALSDAAAPPPVAVPAGPDFFGFADDGRLAALLTAAGVADVRIRTVAFAHDFPSGDDVWDGILGGSVRTAAAVRGQEPATRRRVRTAFDARVAAFGTGRSPAVTVPVAAKLAVGRIRPRWRRSAP